MKKHLLVCVVALGVCFAAQAQTEQVSMTETVGNEKNVEAAIVTDPAPVKKVEEIKTVDSSTIENQGKDSLKIAEKTEEKTEEKQLSSFVTPVTSVEDIRSMGKADAPLKMYVFSSLTCPHCADFYREIIPFVEKEFVQTGDVFLTYVDLPYDRRSLAGAMIAHCVPAENYFDFLGLLYEKQKEWAFLPNAQDVVTNYALAAGLTRQEVKDCLKNQKVLRKLMATRDEMTKQYNIKSTPTVLLKKGEETRMVLGADKPRLLKKIKSMLKK